MKYITVLKRCSCHSFVLTVYINFRYVIFIKIKFRYLNIKIIFNIRYTNNNINLKENVFFTYEFYFDHKSNIFL